MYIGKYLPLGDGKYQLMSFSRHRQTYKGRERESAEKKKVKEDKANTYKDEEG
jgi:hypothetical protein